MTKPLPGGAFFTTDQRPEDLFGPENFTSEHLAIARTAREFWYNEIEPRLAAIGHKQPGALAQALRKSGELGLTALSIPERFGGMELDLASMMIVEECFSLDASYLVTHGGHAGIGTLPLVYFGTEEQKARYLPRLATAEMIAASSDNAEPMRVKTHTSMPFTVFTRDYPELGIIKLMPSSA